MKLKHIESAIQQICPVQDFDGRPTIDLEQYTTPPRLAAEMISTIQYDFDDIEGKIVADFGCGCGILSAGCLLMEPDTLYAVDVDMKCIEITQMHLEEVDGIVEYLHCNINEQMDLKGRVIDTVITNPPFGTRVQGADLGFVVAGLKAANVVYSLHKTSTRENLRKKAREMGANGEVVSSVSFALPKMYKMHKKKSVDIEVDFWRFTKVE
ncbi:unnamed protein product [Blepharisma stoltei]|uniref:Methyltransferase-like protein 5 n=1 Tax=Blepharisma stoltei TaxID=1481888 RepID=A0AAU9IWR9_9CILI|nr:unnamed protein product [Blepharisma stoltei]